MIKQFAINLRRQAYSAWRGLTQPHIINHTGGLLEIGDHISPKIIDSLYCGDYERSELKGIRKNLRKDDVVLELGRGLGFTSLYCAQRIGAERVFTRTSSAPKNRPRLWIGLPKPASALLRKPC
jgi:hypothetical protein